MSRVHLFEFFDQAWVPHSMRHLGGDYLAFIERSARGPVEALLPVLEKGLAAAPRNEKGVPLVVDVCSGAAGPWPLFVESLPQVQVTLTDLSPNLPALQKAREAHPGRIAIDESSVDALQLDPSRLGCRTIVNGLHHFQPDQARAFLQAAVSSKQPVVVLEMMSRSFLGVITSPLILLFVLLLTPFLRPSSFQRLFFTYAVPVLPIMIWWDGLVSGLRVYSVKELEQLVDGLEGKDSFDWEIAEVKAGPMKVPTLVGTPKSVIDAVAERHFDALGKLA